MSVHQIKELPSPAIQRRDCPPPVERGGDCPPLVNKLKTVADLVVGFNAFKERFTSRVEKDRPNRILVDYVEGPLKFLHNEWRFERADDGGTNLYFSVDFAFRSRIFEAVAGQVFDRALRRMTKAFEERAAELYGINKSSAQSAA